MTTQVLEGLAVSCFGVTNAEHGARAVKWLADRCMASWYDRKEGSLRAFPFKQGLDWTGNKLGEAILATRRGRPSTRH